MNHLKRFIRELQDNSTNVPFPLQQKAAEFIASAWNTRPDDAATQAMPASLGKELSVFGPASTIGEAENLILASHYGTMGELAQGVIHNPRSSMEVGDVFGVTTQAGLESFHNYDPSKGSFGTHLIYSMRDALKTSGRTSVPSGSDARLESISTDSFRDPSEDPAGYVSPWGGTTAPYGTPDGEQPSNTTWYQEFLQSLNGGSIPTGLYAPAGQGLMLGGQLNPRLSIHPFQGSQQVTVNDTDIREYASAVDSGVPLSAKPGLEDRVATSLRKLAGGLQGNDTVGGNALGYNMQQADREFYAQPFGMQEARGSTFGESIGSSENSVLQAQGTDTSMRSRTPELMEANAGNGQNFFDVSGGLRSLAATPSQMVSANMVHDIRVTGKMSRNPDGSLRAVSRVKYNEKFGDQLTQENRAGYAAANRVNPSDIDAWVASHGDLTSGVAGVPEEYVGQYRSYMENPGKSGSMRPFTEMPEPVHASAGIYAPAKNGGQPPVPPTPPVDLATPEPSDDGNFHGGSAKEAMAYIQNNHGDFVKNFLGTGETKMEDFKTWRAGLSEAQGASFDRAWGVVMQEKGIADKFGAPSEWHRAVVANGGWRGSAPKNTPEQFTQPVPETTSSLIDYAGRDHIAGITDDGMQRAAQNHVEPIQPVQASVPEPNVPLPVDFDVDPVSGNRHSANDYAPWERAAQNQGASVFGAGRGPSGAHTPSSNRVTAEYLADWKVNSADLSLRNTAGFHDERLGSAEVIAYDRNTKEPSSVHLTSDGQETLSAQGVSTAVSWAQQATGQALNSGALTDGMDANSASATMQKAVWRALDGIAKKYVDALGGDDPDLKLAAERRAVSIKTVAGKIAGSVTGNMREDLDQQGDDGRNRAIRLGKDTDLAQSAMNSNPEFASWVDGQPGGLNGVLNGPQRIINAGDDVFSVGGSSFGGRGGGPGGPSGGAGGRSIYQTPAGRFMMEMAMASYAWKDTGGAVLTEADAYGMSQAYQQSLAAYGGGSVTGAPAYAGQKSVAASESGRLAYQAYGGFGNIGFGIGGGAIGNGLIQLGNAGKIAAGAGIMAGAAAYGTTFLGEGALAGGMIGTEGAIGAAALPIGIGVAAAVGAPLLGMAAFNAFTGNTPDTGLSLMNVARTEAMAGGEMWQGSTNGNVGEWGMGVLRTINPLATTGSQIQENLSKEYPGLSKIEQYKQALGPALTKQFPQAAAWLAGSTPQEDQIQALTTKIAADTGQSEQAISAQLQPIQSMLGGLGTAKQTTLATQLVDLSQATGQNEAGVAAQMASLRGLAPGTTGYASLVQQYADIGTGPSTNQERLSAQLQAQSDAQGFSEFAPYLHGTTTDAASLYYSTKMTMPQAQQFASIASAAALSQGSQLSLGQALSLGAESQNLGKYSTSVGSMASQLDMMGIGNFSQNYSQLGGLVSNGANVPEMQQIMSGNAYAWSAYGRQAGIGAVQTMQANGLAEGTTDISGLLQFARQQPNGQAGWTNTQALSSAGITNPGIQQSLITGGAWLAQTTQEQTQQGYQMQGYGIQQSQLSSNLAYTNQSFGFQQEQTGIQWGATQYGFGSSQTQLNLSNEAFAQNLSLSRQQNATSYAYQTSSAAFQQGTIKEQEQFSRQDYNFGVQMNQLQYGWNLSDANLAISRSTGFERAQLVKQRDRMVESNTLNVNHAAQDESNQEDLWKREDAQYQKQVEYNTKMQALELEAFNNEESQHKKMSDLDQKNLDEQIKVQTELHNLELQMQAAAHAHDIESLTFSQEQLDLQIKINQSAFTYQQNMEAFTRLQATQSATWQQITSYAPAWKAMMDGWLRFMQSAENIRIPSGVGQ